MSYGGKRVSPSKWPLMNDLSDAVGFFVGFLRCIKQGTITLDSSLEKIVWTVSWDNLAYMSLSHKGLLKTKMGDIALSPRVGMTSVWEI